MKPNAWGRRFLQSTRGRIVTLLWQAERTASELAQALGLTTNAVRTHLAALERDGLVRPQGVRRGAFRPTATYALTPEAEHLLPRPYKPLLRAVLDALTERLPDAAVDQVVRAACRHMAA